MQVMTGKLELAVDRELTQPSSEGVRVSMYLAGASERIDGWVQLSSGSRQTFTGWLELISALQNLLVSQESPAPRGMEASP